MAFCGSTLRLLSIFVIYHSIWFDGLTYARKNESQKEYSGFKWFQELTTQDCLYLGKHYFNNGMYRSAVKWFEEAYVLSGKEFNASVSQGQITIFLNAALKEHEKKYLAANQNKKGASPVIGSSKDDTVKVSVTSKQKLGNNLTDWEYAINFLALCRGESLLSEAYISSLSCYYDHRGEPYLYLMPAKVERLHHDPEILKFHHLLTDDEIQEIKDISNPILSPSLVVNKREDKIIHTVSNTRTSKSVFLDDQVNPLFQRISLYITRLTGLSLNVENGDAENFQVANYGVGGYYIPHYDYLLVNKSELVLTDNANSQLLLSMGDRIATFMFYLNDVTLGGATAFPKLGAAAWPSEGSAVFWYNLKRSGAVDSRTLHGACPVLHGNKWVANKWIHENSQILKRKCGLTLQA